METCHWPILGLVTTTGLMTPSGTQEMLSKDNWERKARGNNRISERSFDEGSAQSWWCTRNQRPWDQQWLIALSVLWVGLIGQKGVLPDTLQPLMPLRWMKRGWKYGGVRVFLVVLFLINLGGKLQGWVADREGLGDEWDWGTRCEISKVSIKNYI